MIRLSQRATILIVGLAIGTLITGCSAPAPTAVPPPTATVAPAPTATVSNAPWLERKRAFALIPTGSSVTFRVQEQFLGVKVPEDAVGTSKAMTGRIALSPEPGILAEDSFIELDSRSLRTDLGQRDGPIRTALGAFQFPTIRFVPRELRGLPKIATPDGSFKGSMVGDLTIKGVTKPVTFEMEGTFKPGSLTGSGRGELNMTDYGITPPKTMEIIWVQELVRLEFVFVAEAAD